MHLEVVALADSMAAVHALRRPERAGDRRFVTAGLETGHDDAHERYCAGRERVAQRRIAAVGVPAEQAAGPEPETGKAGAARRQPEPGRGQLEDGGPAVRIEYSFGLAEDVLVDLAIVAVTDDVIADGGRDAGQKGLEAAAETTDWKIGGHRRVRPGQRSRRSAT